MANITGVINATSGSFTGTVTSSDATITGGSLTITGASNKTSIIGGSTRVELVSDSSRYADITAGEIQIRNPSAGVQRVLSMTPSGVRLFSTIDGTEYARITLNGGGEFATLEAGGNAVLTTSSNASGLNDVTYGGTPSDFQILIRSSGSWQNSTVQNAMTAALGGPIPWVESNFLKLPANAITSSPPVSQTNSFIPVDINGTIGYLRIYQTGG